MQNKSLMTQDKVALSITKNVIFHGFLALSKTLKNAHNRSHKKAKDEKIEKELNALLEMKFAYYLQFMSLNLIN